MRDRRRIGAFALICAASVGAWVWWNVGGQAAGAVVPTAGERPVESQPVGGTPIVSKQTIDAPSLPDGWTFVGGTEVPVAAAGAPQLPVTAEDDNGASVEITDLDRVVVGGDDVIEIMDALGLSASIYAAPNDTTLQSGADAPEHFTFNKDTGPEGILKLRASLFIGNSVRRHAAVVGALASTSTPAVIVEQNQSPVAKIRRASTILGRGPAGDALAGAVQAQLATAKRIAARRGASARPRVLQVAVGGGGRVTVAGLQTPPDAVIAGAGGVNVAAEAGLKLYADMSDEGLLASKPDVILVTVADLATWGGAPGLWKTWPTLQQTPAGRANRVMVMPDAQLSGGSVAAGAGTIDLATALGGGGS